MKSNHATRSVALRLGQRGGAYDDVLIAASRLAAESGLSTIAALVRMTRESASYRRLSDKRKP